MWRLSSRIVLILSLFMFSPVNALPEYSGIQGVVAHSDYILDVQPVISAGQTISTIKQKTQAAQVMFAVIDYEYPAGAGGKTIILGITPMGGRLLHAVFIASV